MSGGEALAGYARAAQSGLMQRRQEKLPLLWAAGITLLTAVPVVQGKLHLLDVACILAVPFIAARVKWYGPVRVLSLALVTWVIGQLLSDVVNGLGLRISMQTVIGTTVLAISLVLVFLARGDFRRIRCLVVGVAVGLALQQMLAGHASIASRESWKFGLDAPVSLGLLALADLSWRRGQRVPSLVALAAICALGVATDHRHLAGLAALSAILLLPRHGGQRHPRVVSVVAAVMLLLAVLSGVVIQAAETGVLGERSGGQIEQFGSSPKSIIVNTRPEPFHELYLFARRPFFGWGSHPRLDTQAYLGSKDFLQSIGVVRTDLDDLWLSRDPPGVTAHSQAPDSFARAGLLAVPFWLLFLALAVSVGISAIRFRSSPLVVFWTMLVLWDWMFSPLTVLSHFTLAAYLALAITSLQTRWSGIENDPIL
jgi:hypothetical protein